MKNSLKCTFVLLLLVFLSSYAHAQYAENTFMISFEPGTSQAEIDLALSDFQATELDITPITNVRLWQIDSFGFIYPPTGTPIIDINDARERSVNRVGTNGGGLNLFPSAYTDVTGMISPDLQNDCDQTLSTYTPNGEYPVSVGFFDTGYEESSNSNPDYFFNIDYYNEWDHLNNDPDADDANGHGSHMTSIASHAINKAYGLGESTIEPDETYELRKCFDANGRGHLFEIIDALEHAALNGMNVANCSWSFNALPLDAYDSPLYTTLSVLEQDYKMLIVAAAGNEGENLGLPSVGPTTVALKNYPAAYDLPNILTATSYNCEGDLALFSNYGFEDIDIALPGLGLTGIHLGLLDYRSGTSQSAALLSGIAASLGTHLEDFHYAPIICAIMESAVPHPMLQTKVKSGGYIDADGALAILHNCSDEDQGGGQKGEVKRRSRTTSELFPNPSIGLVTVNYNSDKDDSVAITVTDLQGRNLYKLEYEVYAGQNTLELKLDNLSAGLYNLTLENSKKVESYKIIIEK